MENFLPLHDTYPRHPLQDEIPLHASKSELLQKRKQDTKKYVGEKIALWEKHNPTQVVIETYKPRTESIKPKFTSMKQIKEEKLRLARESLGMTERTDIKIVDKDPSLKYVYDPEIKTKGDLYERTRKDNFELSKKILSKKHMNEIERLKYREDEIFDMGYYAGERKTYSKIKDERKKENVDYNMKVFSKQTIGVHGHELPKFSESDQYREYWKFKEDWVENPKYQSQVELLEDQKYWKRKEDFKIKDYREEEANIDDFKRVFVPKDKKVDVILKVNKLNHFKNFDPDNPQPIDVDNTKRKHIYRWTTLVNQFSSLKIKNGRYFDNLPTATVTPMDEKGLYSSFNEDGIFKSKFGKEYVF